MKKHTFVLTLIFLAIVFQWSCDKESDTLTDQSLSVRHHPKHDGNNGNGGNDGGNALYGFQFDGDIVYGEKTYATVVGNNGKYTQLDAEYCGSVEVTGMGTLHPCYSVTNCSEFLTIKQLDKKKDPQWVTTSFWIRDPITFSQSRLAMWGKIQNTINGKYTLEPIAGQNVEVVFDEWATFGECEQDKISFSSVGLLDQHLTIWYVPEEDILTICEGVGLNCQ